MLFRSAIKTELEQFTDAVLNDHQTPVTVEEGLHALTIANQIMDKINLSLNVLA